jgi:hypothetical protein
MSQDFEKLFVEMTRSSGSAALRKEGAKEGPVGSES